MTLIDPIVGEQKRNLIAMNLTSDLHLLTTATLFAKHFDGPANNGRYSLLNASCH